VSSLPNGTHGTRCPAAGCWLLAARHTWHTAAGCWLLAARLLAARLLAAGCPAAGCWLLAAGCWLLAAGCLPVAEAGVAGPSADGHGYGAFANNFYFL
jgi:hypothetical protein